MNKQNTDKSTLTNPSNYMTSQQIRQAFLDFFASKHHSVVASSSLVPDNDPSLLFTNAGMVPFKNVFLGIEQRPYTRAVSAQRCIRAGGKHNDLENVGYTARHHTFFEMLGNFSFGDYFKTEAIQFAWDFITQVLAIPQDKLWVSVYRDDQETADLWINQIGFDPKRISYCDEKDNFWTMGDTGPCGPCTEIFYDHGPDIFGGPPGTNDEDGDRFIEIWNIVFTQFDRSADGSLSELPKPSVDTGMGLERLAAVLQGVHNNYETDLFQQIITKAADLANLADHTHTSLRVIADHIRSSAFLIVDGVLPANEGRGYVLRRIIRRAIRHGHRLGMPSPFFYQLVRPLVSTMGQAYPELAQAQSTIEAALQKEEALFMQTLAHGLKLLEKAIAALPTSSEGQAASLIPGSVVFKLYDTYGFPVDLTADYAREQGYQLDDVGFQQCMAEQQARSKQASKFAVDYSEQASIADIVKNLSNTFLGYEQETTSAQIIQLIQNNSAVDHISNDQDAIVILDQTVFYGEAGGQVGDTGELRLANGTVFSVLDCQKINQVILHYGRFHGASEQDQLCIGTQVQAEIDSIRRTKIRANHSATHLLHLALQQVLGAHVEQKGSLVNAEKLRLDIAHDAPIAQEQLHLVEQLLNQYIRQNTAAITEIMDLEQAKAKGAMALFGEKYDNTVRVLTLGDSVELCGGTHVQALGDIGLCKIISETGIAAGVRRIEAMTGEAAWLAWYELTQTQKAQEQVLQQKLRSQDKQLAQLKSELALAKSHQLVKQAETHAGVQILVQQLHDIDAKALRTMAENIKQQLSPALVLLASSVGEKVSIIAAVSKPVTEYITAGELVNHVAQQVGGKGGGKPELAQAGGNDVAQLPTALDSVLAWVLDRLPVTDA